jgi:tetratricopeptide (TPR) repeat protein
MKTKESILKGTIYFINVLFRILTPPFYSLTRVEKYCKACLRKNPNAYIPRWFLAGLYHYYKKYEEAKREYQELQQRGYLKEKDCLNMAEILCILGFYEDVKKILTPIIDRCVNHKSANWSLAVSYMKTEEFNKAAVYFERLIAAGSRRYEDYWDLGFCYSHLGDFEKAKEAYSKALSIKPDSKELRENLAFAYIGIGQTLAGGGIERSDLAGAEAAFRKALDINPGNPTAMKLIKNTQEMKTTIELMNDLSLKISCHRQGRSS